MDLVHRVVWRIIELSKLLQGSASTFLFFEVESHDVTCYLAWAYTTLISNKPLGVQI